MCGCLSHAPHWGLGLQPRHVPRLGIEPVTLLFSGSRSIHWATPARAFMLFKNIKLIFINAQNILVIRGFTVVPKISMLTIVKNQCHEVLNLLSSPAQVRAGSSSLES